SKRRTGHNNVIYQYLKSEAAGPEGRLLFMPDHNRQGRGRLIEGAVRVRSAVHPGLFSGRNLALVNRMTGSRKYCRRRAQKERDSESNFGLGRHGIVSFFFKSAGILL